MPQLALGTAQFGLDYGVTNVAGRVPSGDVEHILSDALEQGVLWLDTAAAYGEAQQVLCDARGSASFKICTKVGAGNHAAALTNELEKSLLTLKRQAVDILLLHRPSLLEGAQGRDVRDWLFDVKSRGTAKEIGVSVYTADEADLAAEIGVDWIQLPLSVLDQSWLSEGRLARLRSSGVKVQARSILAQGLVAIEADRLPPELHFIAPALRRLWAEARARQVLPVDLALAFIAQAPIQMAIIGVQSSYELSECIRGFRTKMELDWRAFAAPGSIDPRTWPSGMKVK